MPASLWPGGTANPQQMSGPSGNGAFVGLLGHQGRERCTVSHEPRDELRIDVGHNDFTYLVVDLTEEAVGFHSLGLPVVVLGGREVVHHVDLVSVDEK